MRSSTSLFGEPHARRLHFRITFANANEAHAESVGAWPLDDIIEPPLPERSTVEVIAFDANCVSVGAASFDVGTRRRVPRLVLGHVPILDDQAGASVLVKAGREAL